MDKPKILIVGADPSSASLARLPGTALSEQSICIIEDHKRLLEQMDYSALEYRIAAQIPMIGKRPNLVIYDDMCITKAADHPSRKREPKGPRGKWGKPK